MLKPAYSMLNICYFLMSIDYNNTGYVPNAYELANPKDPDPKTASGNKYYYERWLFDITYWVIMIIILMGVIGRLIIDTFADLRVKRN